MIQELLSWLREATDRLPALKFAWGLLGISFVAAIITLILGKTQSTPIIIGLTIIGTIITFVTVWLFENSNLATRPAQFLIWAVTIFFVIFLGFTTLAFAVGLPCNWSKTLGISPNQKLCLSKVRVDYERKVDFTKLKYNEDRTKHDEVVYEDIVTFVDEPKSKNYYREFRIPRNSSVKVTDVINDNSSWTPHLEAAGNELYGNASFKIDFDQKQAHFKWTYKNTYSTSEEGIGFSSSKNYELRNVNVTFTLPKDKKLCGDRKFKPEDLDKVCLREENKNVYEFCCKDLSTQEEIREIWTWDIWEPCPR